MFLHITKERSYQSLFLSKSKVIILLTDGVNNAGKVDPITAAGIAKEFDITVYTIGIGKKNNGSGFFSFAGDDVDEETLTQIASITNGKYFRAQNQKELQI